MLCLFAALTVGTGWTTSSWDTIYGDYAGNFAVPARLEFHEKVGSYFPEGKTGGVLSDIRYRVDQASELTWITGKWSYNHISGWFSFTILPAGGHHGPELTGSWGYGEYLPKTRPAGYWLSRQLVQK